MTDSTVTVTATTPMGTKHEIVPGLTSIIMPVLMNDYSLFHYTGNAIGAVKEHTDSSDTPYEIVLIDNGSAITLPDPKMYNVDKYVRNEANLGVTKAWNQGIRISQGEYICLLNNDTMVFNHWLNDLHQALEHVDLIMATPMYGEPFARAKESEIKRGKWLFGRIDKSFHTLKDFSCVLTKRKLFEEIGMFDEDYLMYAQDSDLFKRMDMAGKKYAATKQVPIFHIIGATSTGIPETPDLMNKDKEVFANKWEGKGVSQVQEQTYQPQQPAPVQPAPVQPMTPPIHPDPSPAVPQVAPEQPKEYTVETMPELIRTKETGDRVYFVRGGKAHWVTNPEVLKALGKGFDDVVGIERRDYLKLSPGEPINTFNVAQYGGVPSQPTQGQPSA